jgi:hypothetical protein
MDHLNKCAHFALRFFGSEMFKWKNAEQTQIMMEKLLLFCLLAPIGWCGRPKIAADKKLFP